jgi:hypothetical protein
VGRKQQTLNQIYSMWDEGIATSKERGESVYTGDGICLCCFNTVCVCVRERERERGRIHTQLNLDKSYHVLGPILTLINQRNMSSCELVAEALSLSPQYLLSLTTRSETQRRGRSTSCYFIPHSAHLKLPLFHSPVP